MGAYDIKSWLEKKATPPSSGWPTLTHKVTSRDLEGFWEDKQQQLNYSVPARVHMCRGFSETIYADGSTDDPFQSAPTIMRSPRLCVLWKNSGDRLPTRPERVKKHLVEIMIINRPWASLAVLGVHITEHLTVRPELSPCDAREHHRHRADHHRWMSPWSGCMYFVRFGKWEQKVGRGHCTRGVCQQDRALYTWARSFTKTAVVHGRMGRL